MTEEERAALGAVLSRPIGLSADDKGRIYVWDADYKKVVIFGSNGSFESVIAARFGEGPGEFVGGRDIALGRDGQVLVLDGQMGRIIGLQGAASDDVTIRIETTQPTHIEVLGDHMLLSRFVGFRAGRHAVVRLQLPGGELEDSLIPLSDQELNFHEFGEPGVLGRGPHGSVLYASPVPAQWYKITSSTVERFGTNYYEDVEGFFQERGTAQVRVVPIGVRGITALPDGRIVLFYSERYLGTDSPTTEYYLDVFESDGRYVGSARLETSEETYGRMASTPDGSLIFTSHVTFPGVVKMRLVRQTDE